MTQLAIPQHVILGTGQLGLAIMDELVAQGLPVRLVNRRGRAPEPLPPSVEIVAGDVTNPADVARLCTGAKTVFLCAQPSYTEWPEKFPPLIQGVIQGLSGLGVKLVFGDNLYMYGSTHGQPLHEGLPYAATGHKGRTRAQIATQLLDAHRQNRVPVVIGRASDFYGPRVTNSAVGEGFFAAALAGKAVNLIGDIGLPHTYTYIRDFARALITLSQQESAYGQAWHIPNDQTLTTRQFVDLVAQEMGHAIKIRTIGPLGLTLVGLFQPVVREMKEMYYEFAEPYQVDHSRFAQQFGNGVTPHRQAIQETVAWYRQHQGQG
ncbi:MAG: NAD-dependent epimerase/dehydratase family protein [Chloroflexi bacterium]|nr:NAD-dependent epimerase/dehydratase family protein [Chloroflexota bacterium]MBP8057175.1 NAD-dependent epimerase/dehydratase family protein [Chloroflexota bacterium]